MDDAAFVLSMGVTGGLIALAAALLVATGLGVALRRRAGRFGPGSAGAPGRPSRAGAGTLTAADLGSSLGRQATLVQFSTAFCAPCRPTRQLLAQVADTVDGVTHVEIDAASRLDLVRRLRINSTPTVLVLGFDAQDRRVDQQVPDHGGEQGPAHGHADLIPRWPAVVPRCGGNG